MKTRPALTLIELLVVLCVLVAISTVAIPLSSNQVSQASATATRTGLAEIHRAVLEYWHDTKFVVLDGTSTVADEPERFEIRWLFLNPVTGTNIRSFDPATGIGWNGPYLTSATSVDPVPGLIDAWGTSIEVHYANPGDTLKDVRLVSAGANRVLETPDAMATTLLTPEMIGDDVYVAIMLR